MEKAKSSIPESDFEVIEVKPEDLQCERKTGSSDNGKIALDRTKTVIIREEKKKKYDGSLLRLFKSDFFNVHLLITHLLRSKNEGTMDYLINELYTEHLEDIDFYMPQLCYMALTDKKWKSLIKFILDMTPKYPNLGLKAMLYIFSYSQDEGSPILESSAELSNVIETVIVNNEVPLKYRTKTLEDEGISDPQKYLDKIHRDKYKNEQLTFLDILKNTSLKLKTLDIEARTDYLHSKLRDLNRWIIKSLRGWEIDHDSDYEVKFHGMQIPLYQGDDQDPLLIVNIVSDLARWFNTKERCPIMVVFETINFSEAKKRKSDLSTISDSAYTNFESIYSAEKTKKKKNIFELNGPTKQKSANDGVAPSEELVVENDDYLKRGDTEFDQDFKSPFDDDNEDDEEEKVEVVKDVFPHDKHLDPWDPNDPNFKSFEKFAKFVQMEEGLFSDSCSSDNNDDDRDSVTSALYTFEYGHGAKRRKRDILSLEDEVKAKPRSRSAADRIFKSKYTWVPRNIRRLKEAVHKLAADGEGSKKNISGKKILALEHRPSDLFMEMRREDSHSNKLNREEILKDHSRDVEDDVGEYLEGMKDPFGQSWAELEVEMKKKSVYKDFETYRLRSLIFKSNDDLRQELLAIQLIK